MGEERGNPPEVARLARPLYEGGERCNQRHFINGPATKPLVPTDHCCSRDPHDDGVHECPCRFRWTAQSDEKGTPNE